MSSELHNVDQRVAKIEATLQQLANAMVLTARQDEQIISIERRVDRLEQGATKGSHDRQNSPIGSLSRLPFHNFDAAVRWYETAPPR